MIQFEYIGRHGVKRAAHYAIEGGQLSVSYRGETMSVAAGVNEIANAFLRENLIRSILGEIETSYQPVGSDDPLLSGTGAAQ